VWWIAGYALFRGALLLTLAFRLRRHAQRQATSRAAQG
jgi:hypothetical protein